MGNNNLSMACTFRLLLRLQGTTTGRLQTFEANLYPNLHWTFFTQGSLSQTLELTSSLYMLPEQEGVSERSLGQLGAIIPCWQESGKLCPVGTGSGEWDTHRHWPDSSGFSTLVPTWYHWEHTRCLCRHRLPEASP